MASPSLGPWSSMAPHGEEETASRQPYQIASSVVFLALSVAAVALRIWVRTYAINSFGKDDVMMLIALFMYIMYNAALMVIVANGGGTHITTLEALKVALNWTSINEIFYLLTTMFLKLSLGIFFLRVVSRKWQRRVIIWTMILSTVINAYHIFYVIFQCGNPKYFTERLIQHKCVPTHIAIGLAYEQAAVATVADCIFMFMPIPVLWNARMDLRHKISVGLILSLGTFGSVASIIRFLYIDAIAYREDFFWSAVNLSIWSTIELGVGIVVGSLATLRPLLKRWVSSARRHMTHGHEHNQLAPKSSHQYYGSASAAPYPINLASPSSPPRKLQKERSWSASRSKGSRNLSKNADTGLNSLQSVFQPWELVSLGEAGGITTTTVSAGGNNSSSPGGDQSSPASIPLPPPEYTFSSSRDAVSWPSPMSALNYGPEAWPEPEAGSSRNPFASSGALDVDAEQRAAIWPFMDDTEPLSAHGISKVVDVEVSVSETPPGELAFGQRSIEARQALAAAAEAGQSRSHSRKSSASRAWFGLNRQKTGSASAPTTMLSSQSGGGLWGQRYEDRIQSPQRSRVRRDGRPSTPEWERLPDLFPREELEVCAAARRRSSEGSGRSRSDRNSFSEGSAPSHYRTRFGFQP